MTLAVRNFDRFSIAALTTNIQHSRMDQVSRSQTSSYIEIISRVLKILTSTPHGKESASTIKIAYHLS